jgi:ATPase subunit of ABC transporter with duplicated ATPase domains
LKRDIELERKRQEAEDKYRKQRQEIEDEMDLLQRQMKYEQEEQDQMKEIKQKQETLKSLKQAKLQAEKMKQQRAKVPAVANTLPVFNTGSSDAASEWQYFKNNEGATNEALDELMGMIGLESVKKEFLSIKTSVDTKLRQGVSLSKERFSCSLLGNPGTGKL